MKFLRPDAIPSVPGGGWVFPWCRGGGGCAEQEQRRSHFKNQQLLTLNMLIFIVRRGGRLPAFCAFSSSFFFFVVDFIVGDQFTGPLLTFTPAHLPPDRQNNSHPSVHTLIYKHKFMQKCGAISEYTSSSSQTSHRRASESAFYTS